MIQLLKQKKWEEKFINPSAKEYQIPGGMASNTWVGSSSHKSLLMVLLGSSYISFGALFSMPEPIYPYEAKLRGATSYEVG